MSQTAKEVEFVHVDRLLEAPIIYVDAVPKFSVREQMISVTLAATVVELVSKQNASTHLVAVADLRMTAPTALQLRDLLDKALLAMQPIPRAAN
jgi:hypothetical protein